MDIEVVKQTIAPVAGTILGFVGERLRHRLLADNGCLSQASKLVIPLYSLTATILTQDALWGATAISSSLLSIVNVINDSHNRRE
jgi:hypothetical protein